MLLRKEDTVSRVQIDKFKYDPQKYNIDELIKILKDTIDKSLSKPTGLLLSGGVDSTIMAILIKEIYGNIKCFTIGKSVNHPDLMAGIKIAKELGLPSISMVVSDEMEKEFQQKLIESNTDIFPGDVGVLIALDLCKEHGFDNVIATDGIDEMMGGYWWHANKSDKFATIYDTFEYFWDKLDSDHLTSLYRSADIVGINIHVPYLDCEVIDYISKIPLEDRIKDKIPKYLWKECALQLGTPQWVIDRPKIGFVDALNKI
jgi:asparagine synthetase B (glutamine-hydrolysing)